MKKLLILPILILLLCGFTIYIEATDENGYPVNVIDNGGGVTTEEYDDETYIGARTSNFLKKPGNILQPVKTTYDFAVGGGTSATADLYVDVSTGSVYSNGQPFMVASTTYAATGTMIYYSGETASLWDSLAIGSTGQVIKVAGGLPTWAADAGGSFSTTTEDYHINNSTGLVSPTFTGNVGIATTSPYGLLSVTNTHASNPSLIVEDTSGDSTPFIIDSAGNVGIGTTPTSKLDIVNSGTENGILINQTGNTASGEAAVRITNTSNTGTAFYIYSNQTGDAALPLFHLRADNAAFDKELWKAENDGTGNAMTLDQNGNVGTNVLYDGAIHVENTGNTGAGFNVYSNLGSTAAQALVTLTADNTDFDEEVIRIQNDGTGAGIVVDGGGTGYSAIFDNGDVGIGDTTPLSKVQVQEPNSGRNVLADITSMANYNLALNALDDSNNEATGLAFSRTSGGIAVGASIYHVRTGSNSAGDLVFATAENGLDNAEKVRITNTGNVGIATTTPNWELSVEGTIQADDLTLETPLTDANVADDITASNYTLTSTTTLNLVTTADAITSADSLKFDKSYWLASSTIDEAYIGFSQGTTSHTLWNPLDAIEIEHLYCKTDTGTVALRCGDGTNYTEYIVCTSSGVADDGSITNSTFTTREDFICEVGSSASTPNEVTITPTFTTN